MSKAKHTPGPWRVHYRINVRAADGYGICSMSSMSSDLDDGGTSQNEANARRIVACVNALEGFADPSAAKDLLEALNIAMQYMPSKREAAKYEHDDGATLNHIAFVEQVLNKAKGE